MKLAKLTLDIGLFTLNPAAIIAFWEEQAGAFLESHTVIREGHKQDRMNLAASVLKINGVAHLDPGTRSGYMKVVVAKEGVTAPRELSDPDDNKLVIAPVGYNGVEQLGVCCKVRSLEAHALYLKEALGLEEVARGVFAVGRSRILLEEEPIAADQSASQLAGLGWRYLALESEDIVADYTAYTAAGGSEAVPVTQMSNNLVRFALVRDPDGNWIEIVQRRPADMPFGLL